MRLPNHLEGIASGLAAAVLFGLSAPLAKLLLPSGGPLMLAAWLYLGGGLGLLLLGAVRGLRRQRGREARLERRDWPLMAGVVLLGGMIGPVLMLEGLSRMSAVSGSLLLNLEGPLTILLAVAIFGEHLGRRAIAAAGCTFGGAVLLGLAPGEVRGDWIGVACLTGACLAWAIDNNLTQRLSLRDPLSVMRFKALASGACLLGISVAAGQPLPGGDWVVRALALGAASYGLSLLLDMHALRILGAAREAALFATAPFVGALAAVPLLSERIRAVDAVAGALMGLGVFLLLRERHGHLHTHEALEHTHLHTHDAHHQHSHEGPVTEPHSHPHRHLPLTHDHPHVSDLHHRHRH